MHLKVRYQILDVRLEVLYYPFSSCLITIWRCYVLFSPTFFGPYKQYSKVLCLGQNEANLFGRPADFVPWLFTRQSDRVRNSRSCTDNIVNGNLYNFYKLNGLSHWVVRNGIFFVVCFYFVSVCISEGQLSYLPIEKRRKKH